MAGRLLDVRGVGDVGLVEVDHQEQRLGRQQLKAAEAALVVAGEAQRPQRLAVLERILAAKNEVALLLELRRLVLLQILLEPLEAALDDAEVGEDQLVFHRLRIARRIDAAGCVRDRLVAKRPDHVHESVGRLVAGDVHERGGAGAARRDDVGELDRRRHPLARVVHRGQDVETGVGHLGNADHGLGLPVSAGGVLGARHQLEERGLACRGQAYEGSVQHKRTILARPISQIFRLRLS